MKGDDLPAADHVVRYVKPTLIQEDGKASGEDFRLRPNRPDETGVSVNWLEALDTDKVHQLAEVRRLFRLGVNKAGRYAELNVGAVRKKVAEELATLRIVHDPLEATAKYQADPSHTEIIGLPPGDSHEAEAIGDLIAECIIAMHPALPDQGPEIQ